jgi:hypothetical protein
MDRNGPIDASVRATQRRLRSEAKPNPSRPEIECQSRKLRDNIDSAKSNFGRRFDKIESAPNEEAKAISQLFKMSDDLGALEDAIDLYGIVPLMILKRQLKAAQNSLRWRWIPDRESGAIARSDAHARTPRGRRHTCRTVVPIPRGSRGPRH